MNRNFKFSHRLATISLICLALLQELSMSHAQQNPEWEYAYEGNVLPTQSQPAWELVEPKIKAGMTAQSEVKDGALTMQFRGEKVSHYYQIGWSGQSLVWRTDSDNGNTLEFRARITQSVAGIPNVFLLSLSGFGPEKKQSAVFYFAPKSVAFAGKSVPLDLSEFHVFRITFDPKTQNISLFVDNAATPVLVQALSEIKPDNYSSSKILIGGTYSPAFQGALELDYLRWTNRGAFSPEAKFAVPKIAQVVPTPTPKVLATRAPIDLKDTDVARANNLFARFDRFPQLAVPQMNSAPQIDGVVNAEEWKSASQLNGLISFITRHIVQKPTRFLLGHDAQNVYLAFQFDRPDKSEVKAKISGAVDNLWNKEDGVELLFSPDEKRRSVFSIYLNGAGGHSTGSIVDGGGFDSSRRGHWKVQSRVTPRGIEGEIAIAKTEWNDVLDKAKATLDPNSWGFNAMRVDLLPQMEQSDWSEMWGAGNYNGNFLGRLNLRPDTVAVRLQTLGALDEMRSGARGVVLNPTSQARRATLTYAIYRATRDVREGKIYLYQTWDKVNRIRSTGSDFDEGAAVQLLMGENNWLKNLGRAYELVREETREIAIPANGQAPFEIAVQQAGGQFIIAAKLSESGTQNVLWSQTSPLDVKAKVELEIQKRFLTAGGVLVRIDAAGSEKADGGTLQSTCKSAGGKVIATWKSTVKSRFVPTEKFVKLSAQPAGNYVVETQLFSSSGEKLGRNRVTFSKPAPPSWWKNKIGTSKLVPSPFTPVKATAASTSIWGRTYFWNTQSPFPRQIETKKQPLLAAPIELVLVSRGKKLNWKTASWKLISATPRTATYRSLHTAGDFKLALTTTVDFDGLMRFRGDFSGAKIPVDSLKLRFPIRREMATHFHAANFETDVQLFDGKYKAGNLQDFAREFPQRATPFAALFWLGGAQGGMQWISQWDKGWHNPDRSRVMKVLAGDNLKSVALEVSFIGQKTTLNQPLPIDFGLNVSPVKDTSYYWKMGTVNGATNALIPKSWDAEKARADLQRTKEQRLTHVMAGGWGWPFHADIWARDHNRTHIKQIVQAIHDAGLQMYYYGCWGYDINGAEARDFGHDLMKLPRQSAGPDTYWYNPEGPWVDFFMAGLDRAIKEYKIDGIYLDSMPNTSLVADPLLGQTYTDEKGRLHGRWPMWGLRDWAMRMQNVFKISHRKNGIVYQHDSSVPNLAIDSLADIRCAGEEAPSRDTLRASWPLDSYFARYDIHAFGIPTETLWYNWWDRPLRENNVLSVILLHGQMKNRTGGDYVPYRLKADYELETTPHIAILKLFQTFDIPRAQWRPYYGAKNWVSMSQKTLLVSSYVHPGKKALVVVSNLDPQPVKTTVYFDLADAGFKPGAVKVTDAFLKTEIPLNGNAAEIEIEKERYRVLLVEAK